MLGHRETSSCGSLKKYEGVRKHYKRTVSILLSEKQRITRARKVFPNIFSLIEVDSEGKKSETLVRVLKFAKEIADSSRILSQIIHS